jgi:hypothetical protein
MNPKKMKEKKSTESGTATCTGFKQPDQVLTENSSCEEKDQKQEKRTGDFKTLVQTGALLWI